MTMMGSLASLFSSPESDRIYGVTVGIVSNHEDPRGMGRVKVKFPQLSDKFESGWIRAVTPMVGDHAGVYFPLKAGDEVLIAFEQGNIQMPYILGALWNGEYRPPDLNPDQSQISSRNGHTITLDDAENQGTIKIKNARGEITITLSSKDNSVTIEAEGNITLKSTNGKLILNGSQGVEIEASGASVNVTANQLEVK